MQLTERQEALVLGQKKSQILKSKKWKKIVAIKIKFNPKIFKIENI